MDKIKKVFHKTVNTAKQKSYQNKKNGVALRSHTLAKHSGVIDPNCPACTLLLTSLKESGNVDYMQWFRLLPGVESKKIPWICNSCKFNHHNCGSPKCGCVSCARLRAKRSMENGK